MITPAKGKRGKKTKFLIYWDIGICQFWKIMKIALFVLTRKNRQIYEGAINFLILKTYFNKLGYQINGDKRNPMRQVAIKYLNKYNFFVFCQLCVRCAQKSEKRKNWLSESKI